MDVDALPALPSGPKGVAGTLLERLEREALAEQAHNDALAAGAARKSGSPAAAGAGNGGDLPTYVPGQKRKQVTPASPVVNGNGNGNSASTSNGPPVSSASTSTVKSAHPASTSMQASTSRGSSHGGGGGNNGRVSSPNGGKDDSTTAGAPASKKPRRQPTIRMAFTFPPYPPGVEPRAKHVPIFNVHDLAESKGLLLPPEELLGNGMMLDDASSSGGSDDEGEGEDNENENDTPAAETSERGTSPPAVTETESQRQIREAIEVARRMKKPVLAKKRVRDRDEGYDTNDPFVDDADLAMNEPKVQARPKVEGFVAIQGEIEVYDNNTGADGKPKKGRKAGSVNRPKVAVTMADGSVKMMSEAIAARDAKKAAKIGNTSSSKAGENSGASESPAPPQMGSFSASPKKDASSTHQAGGAHAETSSKPPSAATQQRNSKGPLMSRDAVMYSHLPSSTASYSASDKQTTTAARETPPTSTSAMSPPPPSSSSAASRTGVAGSRTTPIDIDDDGDVDMSFANTTTGAAGGTSVPPSGSASPAKPVSATPKPTQQQPAPNHFSFDPSPNKKDGKRVYDYQPVSDVLEAQLDKLREACSKESFIPKKIFPASVKPVLIETALLAMETGEYDENFFNIMPNILPYNRFTMNKMIKREVCEVRCAQLEKEITIYVDELRKEVDKAMPEARQAYDEALAKWRDLHDQWLKSKGSNGGLAPGDAAQQNGRNSLTPIGSDGEARDASTTATPADAEPAKPLPKFRFNHAMRMSLFKIMSLSGEVVERVTDKAVVEEKEVPSAMNATKARYASLVQIWPEGFMTSNQLSRELTQAKKKIQSTMAK